MAYLDMIMEHSSGKKVRVRVPSAQGGSDRTIYINSQDTGAKLGNSNDRVYTKHGKEISDTLKGFVKNF